MLKKVMILSGLFLYSSIGFSGELVKNVQLLEVASHASKGTKNFAVLINSGDGICAGTSAKRKWIYFPEDKFPSIASYNQSFSLALTALTAGKNVRIHNYADDSCIAADFISISK